MPRTTQVLPDELASEAEVALARYHYAEPPVIEVDADAKVSRADDGVWVQAWVWLSNDDLEGPLPSLEN